MHKFLRTFANQTPTPTAQHKGANNQLPLIARAVTGAAMSSGETITLTLPDGISDDVAPIAATVREPAGPFRAVTITSHVSTTGVTVLTLGANLAQDSEVRVIYA